MAIYNIFDYYEKVSQERYGTGPTFQPDLFETVGHTGKEISHSEKGQFFSSLCARTFFFLLLVADLAWGAYAALMVLVKFTFCLATGFKLKSLTSGLAKSWLSVKRSIVCGVALMVAIFSPALGIMFSCLYFLMYDKNGVEEIVPSSLQDQFRELFPF